MLSFTKGDWKFLWIIFSVVVVLTFLPIFFGYLTTPPDKVFLFKPNVNGGDFVVYYSYIEQIKGGNFLFKNFFTSEAQPIHVFNTFWLLAGLFAKIFNLSAPFAIQILRFLFIFPFLIAAYYLLSFFFEDSFKKKVCFIIFIFASGLGGVFSLDPQIQDKFLDLFVPEAFTFLTLYTEPHFILSLILFISIIFLSIKALSDYKLKYSLLVGLFSLILFSFHPYHVYSVFLILFSFGVVEYFIRTKLNFNYIKHFIIVSLLSLPSILYQLWTIISIPAVYQHLLQNVTLTPSLQIVIISYGFLIPLAIIGSVLIIKNKQRSHLELMLVVWFVCQLFLLYLPVKTQIRLSEGLQFPIAILVTCGIFYLKDIFVQKIKNSNLLNSMIHQKISLNMFLIYLFFVLFFVSSATVLYTDILLYSAQYKSFYISKAEYESINWLNNTPENSIILSSYYTGNVIPGFVSRQVFIGHSHETANFKEKEKETQDFFKKYDASQRLSFLKENNINYLFWGPEEKLGANFNPNDDNFLQKVYENGEVSIYKVNESQIPI